MLTAGDRTNHAEGKGGRECPAAQAIAGQLVDSCCIGSYSYAMLKTTYLNKQMLMSALQVAEVDTHGVWCWCIPAVAYVSNGAYYQKVTWASCKLSCHSAGSKRTAASSASRRAAARFAPNHGP